MERTKVSEEQLMCPYCCRPTPCQVTRLLEFGTDAETGYRAQECMVCLRSSVWLWGQLIYPTLEMLVA